MSESNIKDNEKYADPDHKIIHIAEEFRRTKRNTLVAASTTTLLAMAAQTDKNAGFSFPGFSGASIEQWAITLLSLIALFYTSFTFIRSDQRLRVRNNQYFFEKSLQDVADQLDDLLPQIADARRTAKAVQDELLKFVSQFSNPLVTALNDADGCMQRALVHQNNLMRESSKIVASIGHLTQESKPARGDTSRAARPMPDVDYMTLKTQREAIEDIESSMQSNHDEITKVAKKIDEHATKLKEPHREKIEEGIAVLLTQAETLSFVDDLPNAQRLREISTNARTSELAWYQLLDRGTVALTVVAAATCAIYRLFDPRMIDCVVFSRNILCDP